MNGFRLVMLIRSLKGRLALVLLISAVIPIILTGYISYHWIYVVQTKKIEADIQLNIAREADELEKRLEDVTSVSQLMDIQGGIGRDVIKFVSSQDELEKAELYNQINDSMFNVNFSNPDLGVMFYYAPNDENPILFPNEKVDKKFQPKKLPLFYEKKLLAYYGPTISMNSQENHLVFSLVRTMNDRMGHTIYAYIEMKIDDLFKHASLVTQASSGAQAYQVLVNPDGNVVYQNGGETDRSGQPFKSTAKGYKIFSAESNQHWKLYQLIPIADYNREIHKWIVQFLWFSGLSLISVVSLTWMMWKMIYKPIRIVNREITHFSNNQSTRPVSSTGLTEFNHLLINFYQMRSRIMELIVEVEEKEKRRGQLEVEKLLVQINPHFLHNTLNTIQWLARIQGQKNIAEMVSIFTRVLHYNLGKKSIIVKVSEEVEAVHDYIALQNIRYDHKFKVELDVDPSVLDVSIPRFILQPLVENALYHGFEQGEGEIQVSIRMLDNSRLLLQVKDNGIGISEEQLEKLFAQDESKKRSGLGIGLHYVKKMLEVYYGESAQLKISSALGAGTTISIQLPSAIKGSE